MPSISAAACLPSVPFVWPSGAAAQVVQPVGFEGHGHRPDGAAPEVHPVPLVVHELGFVHGFGGERCRIGNALLLCQAVSGNKGCDDSTCSANPKSFPSPASAG